MAGPIVAAVTFLTTDVTDHTDELQCVFLCNPRNPWLKFLSRRYRTGMTNVWPVSDCVPLALPVLR